MNDSWQTLTIGELCDKGGGSVQTGPFGSQLHAEDYVADGIPFVMPTNLGENRIIEDEIARISIADSERLSRYRLRTGDIIYGRRGDIGRRALVTEREDGWMCGSGCIRIRFGEAEVEPRFVSFYLGQNEVKELILAKAVGSTMPNLNSEIIRSIPISFPPLSIQRRIADILGALDDKIEYNRRINQTLEAMVQALYKHWFVYSESGENTNGWRPGKLGDIAENVRVPADPRNIPSETPYIGLEHMPRRSIALSEWGTAKDVTSNKWKFHRKQILFGKLRPYFKKVGVAPTDGVCSSDILVIQPRSQYSYGLVLCQLIQDEFIAFTEMSSGGTKMPRISWEQMAQFPIAIPPDNVMRQFNSQIESWVEIIVSNVKENQTLTRTRDYLLPKLLSGEVEVKTEEEQLERAL